MIPAKVSFIGEPFVNGCSQLKSIEVSGQNTDYVTLDGVLYTSDMKMLLDYPAGKSPGECKIPAGVTRIAEYAFQDSAITSVSIPEGVEDIYGYFFHGCKMLRRIDLPASLTAIEDCFDAMGSCDRLECINVSPDNQVYASLDGMLYVKDMTKLLLYPRGRKESSFTVPNGVHSIEKQAFFGNESLTEVILPDGAESIGDFSFASCEKLERSVLPNSLKSIENYAFENCKNLNSIVLPGSLTTLGRDAFSYCQNLKEITIPRGITSIGDSAFFFCEGLVSIEIPPTVTSIDAKAFLQCPALVISGEAGSYAQTFARDNNIPFTITAGELLAGT